eukprot:CAMPEP_0115037962 /NCGR_PEP_ID=MMETSP0216-20121206/43118_1 /TAXON_ID=223996 /ORGANISM="Protocruzia adherens, Strain Boccale" /LENGTH=49 /DNA_ID= /DNA_START= /DNA_END= /DNA_ORIENTATION=
MKVLAFLTISCVIATTLAIPGGISPIEPTPEHENVLKVALQSSEDYSNM